ncbi:SMI1/KNR4 family protein [Chryseobacterium sp. Tr-659]|uniref:SMI1/KNR4 family protein n=1 Tax=Chryseobacterium sp. Tr-659 TaxID=2608340 RepID=UPI0014216508|nr:SMI1/KNR4 family protein [Chryseobacterium sp. Tr-659]NIF05574.1 SMI1/KNR4 family protein [Chryseobacterium sp. Tr-659]
MNSITESFKTIILQQNGLGYHMPKILNPPATEEEISQAEKVLNIKFNHDLRELYSLANGIHNDYQTPSGLTGIIPIHNFLSLADAVDYYNNNIEFRESFFNSDKDFTPDIQLFPFLEDGAGNCFWVDLNPNTNNENKIFWTNTFGKDPDYLYDSLKNLFHTIAESYEKNLFFIDKDGFLGLDYSKFDKISADNNNFLDYWKDS